MAQAVESGLTSVIVVTADSGPLAARCIEGVLACTADVEVVLVDNASRDGQPEAIQIRFDGDRRLRVMRNAANIGFGPACNRAAADARGDGLLILNPDCLIDTALIGRLREAAREFEDVGVLGVRVVDAMGKVEGASRRHEPTLRRALSTLLRGGRMAGQNGINMTDTPPSGLAERVDAISGACMFLPRAVFEAVGGFDEGYFLHCEDLDLCRRVRDAGYAVYHLPTVSVRHDQGSSSRRRPLFVSRHKHRSMWRYFRNFDPAARNPFVRGMVWLGIWTHFALRAPFDAWRQWRR